MENRIRKSSILSVDVPEKQIIEIKAKKRKCLIFIKDMTLQNIKVERDILKSCSRALTDLAQ